MYYITLYIVTYTITLYIIAYYITSHVSILPPDSGPSLILF